MSLLSVCVIVEAHSRDLHPAGSILGGGAGEVGLVMVLLCCMCGTRSDGWICPLIYLASKHRWQHVPSYLLLPDEQHVSIEALPF